MIFYNHDTDYLVLCTQNHPSNIRYTMEERNCRTCRIKCPKTLMCSTKAGDGRSYWSCDPETIGCYRSRQMLNLLRTHTITSIMSNYNVSRQEAIEMVKSANGTIINNAFTLPPIPPTTNESAAGDVVDIKLKLERAKLNEKKHKQEIAELYNRLQEAENTLNQHKALNCDTTDYDINYVEQSSYEEVTPIVLCSDWHVGESVTASTVNGLNEFNKDVAKERIENFFHNVVTRIKAARQLYDINRMVLWLGGDIITGHAHEDLLESNTMHPIEETRFAKLLIKAGIELLLEELQLDQIIIPCNYGNHGRINKGRPRHQTGHLQSFEYQMYHNLADHFVDDDRVRFIIAEGRMIHLDLYGHLIRFHHGDVYQDLEKWIDKQNKIVNAAYTYVGHYHNLKFDNEKRYAINGCILGPSAYSLNLGFRPHPPEQGIHFWSASREVPFDGINIFVDNKI